MRLEGGEQRGCATRVQHVRCNFSMKIWICQLPTLTDMLSYDSFKVDLTQRNVVILQKIEAGLIMEVMMKDNSQQRKCHPNFKGQLSILFSCCVIG